MYIKSVNVSKPIYNGKSLRFIIKNLPKTMHKAEKRQYICNCIEVYNNEVNSINKGYVNALKNTNFSIIKKHFLN